MKNIFEKFSNLFNNKDSEISVANPFIRFAAFIIDSIIIYSIMAVFLFIYIRKDMIPQAIENNEVSFTINKDNTIIDLKNVTVDIENGEKVLNINTKEERVDEFNQIVFNKIYNNKIARYFIILFPIFYNILYLMTKKRATIGQQLFGLMIVKKNAENITFNDVINRVFLFFVCKIPILAVFTIIIPIFYTKNKTTLYDYFSKTYVIKL